MSAQLDKSLDDLISEQRTSRPRSTVHVPKADNRSREGRRNNNQKPQGRGYQEERPVQRAGSSYWQHDDRADEESHRQPGRGPPPAGQRWQRGQQPPGSYRSRAADPKPIITTADGWEEVAQDEPPRRSQRGGGSYMSDRADRGGRGGGYGPQRRRGGVWDRLGPQNDYQENGYGRQKAHNEDKYDPALEDAKPRKPAYYDQHDHRDDPRATRISRRFEPYSRGAGRRGRGRGRGGMPGGGFKWKHDLYDETAQAAAEAAAAEGEEEAEQQEEQQEEGVAEMQE